MYYEAKPLSNGRWGIYEGQTLLATIGCPATCQAIVSVLNQRQLEECLASKSDPLPKTRTCSSVTEVEVELIEFKSATQETIRAVR